MIRRLLSDGAMRGMRMGRIGGCALLAALAGCRTAGIYRPDVQLQLAAQPAAVHPGEAVRLRFTATNPSADSVVLEFQEDCRVSLVVMDTGQRPVDGGGPDSGCMQGGAGRVVVPAGGAWQAAGEWRASTADGRPLPAGTYALRGVLGEHESVFRGRRDFKLGHAADTVHVRVLPAGAP